MRIFSVLLIFLLCLWQGRAFCKEKVIWTDLPENSLKVILNQYDKLLDPVDTLIRSYHRVPKNSLEQLSQRMQLLQKIAITANKVKSISDNAYIINVADTLRLIALSKKNIFMK